MVKNLVIYLFFHTLQIPRQTIKKRYNYHTDIYITELRKRNRRLRKPSVPNRAVTVYKKYFSQKIGYHRCNHTNW